MSGIRQTINASQVLCVIMGGGRGTGLFPLTKERAKAAVPFAGKYRLVDIPSRTASTPVSSASTF